MHRTLHRLPSLDFLRGFEAAGRRLSFTLAAEELFLTQSALSRQVKALEDALGVPLFERRHRALALTAAGAAFHRSVSLQLREIALAAESVREGDARTGPHGVDDGIVRRAVADPAPRRVPRGAAGRRSLRVRERPHGRPLPRRRRSWPCATWPTPVRRPTRRACSASACCRWPVRPCRSAAAAPLKQPSDLARHVLIHLDDPSGFMPWLNWPAWLTSNGQPNLKPAGSLRFSLYDQVIQADAGRAGRRARAHSADLRTVARRQADRAISQALRFAAKLFRRRGAARGGPRPTSPPSGLAAARSRRADRKPTLRRMRAVGPARKSRPHGHRRRSRPRQARQRDEHAVESALRPRAVAMDHALCAACSRRARACSIWRAVTDATRCTSRRGAQQSSRSTATPTALATLARAPGIATRLADLEGEPWPFGERALRRDRGQPLPASPAAAEAACRAGRRRRAAVRDVRAG